MAFLSLAAPGTVWLVSSLRASISSSVKQRSKNNIYFTVCLQRQNKPPPTIPAISLVKLETSLLSNRSRRSQSTCPSTPTLILSSVLFWGPHPDQFPTLVSKLCPRDDLCAVVPSMSTEVEQVLSSCKNNCVIHF